MRAVVTGSGGPRDGEAGAGRGWWLPAGALPTPFLAPSLESCLQAFLEDLLEGTGMAPAVSGNTDGGHDLLVREPSESFAQPRQNQLQQLRSQRQDPAAAGHQSGFGANGKGEQGKPQIGFFNLTELSQIHPDHILEEKAFEQLGLVVAEFQPPVGHQQHHLQMLHPGMLLKEAEAFGTQAPLKAPIRVHLHLQDHHRPFGAAPLVVPGSENAIELVANGFDLLGDEAVLLPLVGLAGLCRAGAMGKQQADQIRLRLKHRKIPLIAMYSRLDLPGNVIQSRFICGGNSGGRGLMLGRASAEKKPPRSACTAHIVLRGTSRASSAIPACHPGCGYGWARASIKARAPESAERPCQRRRAV